MWQLSFTSHFVRQIKISITKEETDTKYLEFRKKMKKKKVLCFSYEKRPIQCFRCYRLANRIITKTFHRFFHIGSSNLF